MTAADFVLVALVMGHFTGLLFTIWRDPNNLAEREDTTP